MLGFLAIIFKKAVTKKGRKALWHFLDIDKNFLPLLMDSIDVLTAKLGLLKWIRGDEDCLSLFLVLLLSFTFHDFVCAIMSTRLPCCLFVKIHACCEKMFCAVLSLQLCCDVFRVDVACFALWAAALETAALCG